MSGLLTTPSMRFHSAAGEMLNHRVEMIEQGSSKTAVVHFTYERGSASYDGRSWTYELQKAPATN